MTAWNCRTTGAWRKIDGGEDLMPVRISNCNFNGYSRFSLLATDLLHDSIVEVMAVADIKDDITAYEAIQHDLEAKSVGKWVVMHDRNLVGLFDSFESAAESAVAQFGRGPYLIRQVGGSPVVLPTSVMYRPEYGTR
jgi:hypothetical protein